MSTRLSTAHSSAIQGRVRLFAVSIAATVLVLLGMIGLWDFQKRGSEAEMAALGQARVLAGHTARALTIADMSLAQLSDRITNRWRIGEPPPVVLYAQLARLAQSLPLVESIRLVGADGRIIADSASPRPPDVSLAGHPALEAHRDSAAGASFTGAPILAGDQSGTLIGLTRRVALPRGGFGGVLVANVQPLYFRGEGSGDVKPAAMALLTDDGILLAGTGPDLQPAPPETGLALPPILPLEAAHLHGGAAVIADAVDGSGRERLIGLATVDGWPLLALTSTDRGEMLRQWHNFLPPLVLAGVLVTILTVMFIRFMSRSLARIESKEEELRLRVEDLLDSQRRLQEQGSAMVGLAEELYHARDEAERARRSADIANRAKSEFLARMSHELRTPLNAILGFSEIMKQHVPGPDNGDTFVQYAGDIHESGNHLLALINDILDLSKVEAGRFELAEEKIDLRHTALSVIRLVRETASRHGVGITVSVAPDIPRLVSDQRVMKQMLLNLLSNSIKFTPRNGTVIVSAQASNGGIEVAVNDTGVGIAEEDIPKVLEPFGQIVRDQNRNGQEVAGTGLGLPLVKSFIEAHGGRFDLKSKVGEGTTVTLWFPPDRIITGQAAAE